MTIRKRLKSLLKVLLQTLIVVGAAVLILWISHYKLIHGPKLQPTESTVSLRKDFKLANGWDQEALEAARKYMDKAGSTSVIVFHDGALVAEWGETDFVSSVHSVRKSIVSALYGIAIEKGMIDINQTLDALGVDDHNPSLTTQEKQARIEDLLTARSGIYHPSVQDDNGPYPAPGSHAPNTAFVYNNWSFNAVGIIFEELTGMKMGEVFKEWIADPVGMQDFKVEDVRYQEGEESVFPAYRFWMSGRDLARFGLLYTQQGQWKGRQVIPASWVERSFLKYSGGEEEVGYGYMWWIFPSGVRMATGTGGQKIWIDPENKLMIVNRVNTGDGFTRAVWWTTGVRVNNTNMRELSRLILEAGPDQ